MKYSSIFVLLTTVLCGSTLTIPLYAYFDSLDDQSVYYGMPKHLVDPRIHLSIHDTPKSVEEVKKTFHYFLAKPKELNPREGLLDALDDAAYKFVVMQTCFEFSGWNLNLDVDDGEIETKKFTLQDHMFFYFAYFDDEYVSTSKNNSNDLLFSIITKLFKMIRPIEESTSVIDDLLKITCKLSIMELKELRKKRPIFVETLRDRLLYLSDFVAKRILVNRAVDGSFRFYLAPRHSDINGYYRGYRNLDSRINKVQAHAKDRYCKLFSKDTWDAHCSRLPSLAQINICEDEESSGGLQFLARNVSQKIQNFMKKAMSPGLNLEDYEITDDEAYSEIRDVSIGAAKFSPLPEVTNEQKISDCQKSYNDGPAVNKNLQEHLLEFMLDYRKEHKEIFADWVVLKSMKNLSNLRRKIFIESLHLRYLALLNLKYFTTLICNYCNILNKQPYLSSYEVNFKNLEIQEGVESDRDVLELLDFTPISFKQLLINQLSALFTMLVVMTKKSP